MLARRCFLYGQDPSIHCTKAEVELWFIQHCLSLPVFLFLIPDVKRGFESLSEIPSETTYAWVVLAGNLVTQLICVSGVNRLSSASPALSSPGVTYTNLFHSKCPPYLLTWF